jgi:hypothetical protein
MLLLDITNKVVRVANPLADSSVDIPLQEQKKEVDIPVLSAEVDIPVENITGTIGPIEGFRNNLSLPYSSWQQFLHGRPRGAIEDNLILNLIRNITGNTTESKLREKYGDKKVDEILAAQKERERGINLSDMKAAFQDDPGAFTAAFVNGIMADPELMITPIGWRTAAVKTAAAMKTASAIKRTTAANIVGAGGASLTAASVIAPISIADQLDKTGEVNWSRVGEETLLAAGLAVTIGTLGAKRFPADKALEAATSTVGSAQVQAVARTPIADAVHEALNSARRTDPYLLGRLLLDKTGAKSITLIDDAAKYSPTLKLLRESIEASEFSKVAHPNDHFQRVSMRAGEFMVRLQAIMDKTRTPFFGVIKKDINDAIIKGLRGGQKTPVSRELRTLLDDMLGYAKESGLDVGEIVNYFPRVYNVKALRAMEDDFLKVLTDNGVDAGDAYSIFQRIIDNDGILDSAASINRIDLHGRPTARAKNLERKRFLKDIPDEALAPFLENDIYPTLTKYISNVTKRAEFARTFGINGNKLNAALKKSMEEMEASGRRMKKHELNRIYDIADAIQGMYRPHESRVIANASRALGSYQIVRTLPLAVLSSITEPLVILARGHLRSTLKSVPALIEHTAKSWVRILYKKFPKPEVTLAAERVGVALDDSIGELLTQTFGGEATKFTMAFFKATLLSQWTRMNRIVGYHAGRHMIIDNLKDISQGKKFRFLEKHDELAELGVSVQDGLAWLKRGAPDDEFTQIIEQGALRFTNEVVMSPRVTNRPLWHSNPNMHLIAQLKGFPTTFGNTVMKRWFHQIIKDPMIQAPRHAAVGATMIMLAMLVNDLRDEAKGVERDPEEPWQRVMRGADRVGLFGIGQLAIDALFAHRFGRSGLAQILGPMASQLDAMGAAVGKSISEEDIDPIRGEAVKAIPVVSQKKSWRDDVEEKLGADK